MDRVGAERSAPVIQPPSGIAGATPALKADTPATAWRRRALSFNAGLLLVVTVITVGGLVSWAGAGDVLVLILGLQPGHLLLTTTLTLTLPLVHTWRFQAVLGAAGYNLDWQRAFGLTLGVWPISAVTPSKSGDLIKAYYLRREVPATATVGSLLAERAVDAGVVAALALVGSAFVGHRVITLASLLVIGALTAFFALAPWTTRLPLSPRWRERIDLLLSSTLALSRMPGVLALTVGLTLTNWLATIALSAVLFDGVGATVPLLYMLAGMPPALLAGLMPLTLAGMGTRDSAIILLFENYATVAQSLSVGILYAFFVRCLLSLIGLPFFMRLMKAG
jgi:uncharacterized membrane protein YbhN (UPF0104 family)